MNATRRRKIDQDKLPLDRFEENGLHNLRIIHDKLFSPDTKDLNACIISHRIYLIEKVTIFNHTIFTWKKTLIEKQSCISTELF